MKKFSFILLSLILIQVPQINSTAVTYPDITQVNPADSPFLLSIWTVDPDNFSRKENICSAVLFANAIVLTAAHCVINDKSIALVAGATDSADRGEVLSVYKWVTHPRYSQQNNQNDIAMGLLNFNARISSDYLLKPTSKFIKNKTRIYGWGVDQNEINNGKPMSVLQNDYSSSAKKYYKDFNKNTQVAGGFYNPTEKTFAGACFGDSGGPLVVKNNNNYELLGLVSYGSGCDTNKPTIYTKVQYYYPWISETITKLAADFKKDNTTRPDINTFSLLPNSSEVLLRKEGPYGYYTIANLQSGGGVKSPDIDSLMFQTYNTGLPFGINAYIANKVDPCIERQKGFWRVQIALSKKQNIDFEFKVPQSSGCYTINQPVYNAAQVLKSPPSQFVCSSPTTKLWQTEVKKDTMSFYFDKGCLATAQSIWIRVFHSIDGDGADLEPGGDMWAGPFSTAIVGQTPEPQPSVSAAPSVISSFTATLDKAFYAQGETANLTITGRDAKGYLVNFGTKLADSSDKLVVDFSPQIFRATPKFDDVSQIIQGKWLYSFIISSQAGTYSGRVKLGDIPEQIVKYVVTK
jgi:hypothetical protein